MANADRCVCCGEIIPEGRMVCPNCEVASKANENGLKDFLEQHGLVMRVCDGAITFCDGDCENCGEEDEDYEAD